MLIPSPLFDGAVHQAGDLRHLAAPVVMFQIQDFVMAPVEVVSDVRDLVRQALGRVRHYSPRRLAPSSTSKFSAQDGHVTAARVCPSALICW